MPFDTPLSPPDEAAFQQWFAQNKQAGNIHPQDMGQDYDMRRAFKAGIQPGADKHWPDTFKKPNHPTFSDESIYSSLVGTKPGHWEGDNFTPFGSTTPQPANPQPGMGFAEQPNLFWRALEGVTKGLRNMGGGGLGQMSRNQPWGMNHEPMITASQAMGSIGQGAMDVASDPRNAWLGMGPMTGMALMGKGIRGAANGMSDMGGFNLPIGEMRRALDMPRPNLRQGQVPGGGLDVRTNYLRDVEGLNQLGDMLSNPQHPSFGFAKQVYDSAPPADKLRVDEILKQQRAMQDMMNRARKGIGGGEQAPLSYGR